MRYKELKINFRTPSTEERCDIAVAELAEMGFDSFSPEGDALSAYISFAEYDKYSDRIEAFRRGDSSRGRHRSCAIWTISTGTACGEADFSL